METNKYLCEKNDNGLLTLSCDMFNVICLFLDFDNLCQLLFVNKNMNKILIPHYDKIKQNITDNESKIILYYDAIKQNQFKLINFLTYLKVNCCNDGLKIAAGLNNQKMIDFLILKGADNWNSILAIVYKNKNKEVIEYMKLKSANDWKLSLSLSVMDLLTLVKK